MTDIWAPFESSSGSLFFFLNPGGDNVVDQAGNILVDQDGNLIVTPKINSYVVDQDGNKIVDQDGNFLTIPEQDVSPKIAFSGSSSLDFSYDLGQSLLTNIELIDLLFTCSTVTSSDYFSITIQDSSDLNQVMAWYYKTSMEGVTSLYYAPISNFLVPMGSKINITWANSDNVDYSGVVRFMYRFQIEEIL